MQGRGHPGRTERRLRQGRDRSPARDVTEWRQSVRARPQHHKMAVVSASSSMMSQCSVFVNCLDSMTFKLKYINNLSAPDAAALHAVDEYVRN